jgi:translation initiation factor 4G
MLNPLEGMFFEKGNKRQGMDDLFGGGGYFTGSAASYLGSSVGSYDGETDGFLGMYGSANGNTSNGYSKDRSSSSDAPMRPSPESRSSPVTRAQQPQHPPDNFQKRDQPRSGEPAGSGPMPPLDFGDRYSANRTRDRERRNDFNKRGPQLQDPPPHARASPHGRNNNNGGGGGNNIERFNNKNDFERGPNNERAQALAGGRGGNQGPHPRDFPLPDSGSKELPPRFKKMSFSQPPPPAATGSPFIGGAPNLSVPPPSHPMMASKDIEVSLRPQQLPGNMLFKPKTPSMLPKSAISRTTDGTSPLGENSLLGPALPTHHKIMQQKEATILIKQGSIDAKGRKEKKAAANRGPTREEVFSKVDAILTELLAHQSVGEAVDSWKENDWLPSKMTQTGVGHLFKLVLEKSEAERQLACSFLDELLKDGAVAKVHCFEAIHKIVSSGGLETAALKSSLAGVAAWAVANKIYTLVELSELFHGGQWHPVFLEILGQLQKTAGKDQLTDMFNAASIRLMEQLPEADRTDEKLVQVLESFELTFLMPLLSIRQDMVKKLAADPSPTSFSKWIADNVDSGYYTQPGFILALFDIVFKHIVTQTTFPPNTDPSVNPDKNVVEAEKELLSKFRSVLQSYVHNNPALQLIAVYALQVFKTLFL